MVGTLCKAHNTNCVVRLVHFVKMSLVKTGDVTVSLFQQAGVGSLCSVRRQ